MVEQYANCYLVHGTIINGHFVHEKQLYQKDDVPSH